MSQAFPGTTLQNAIDHLYEKVVVEESPQSKNRLDKLADLCVEQLDRRGIPGAEADVDLEAYSRTKEWDVVYGPDKPRLAISLKSILSNLGGTVPNRGDGLRGEVVDLQDSFQDVVTGYIVIMPHHVTDGKGVPWADKFDDRLARIAGRSKPNWVDEIPDDSGITWGAGQVEASCLLRVDFSGDKPSILTDEKELEPFFDTLTSRTKERKPSGLHLTDW